MRFLSAIIVFFHTLQKDLSLCVAEVSGCAFDAGTTFNAEVLQVSREGRPVKSMRGKFVHAWDLTIAQWQNDVTDERLFNSISNGRGKMPGFKKHLSEAEIDALVAYVRRLKGNDVKV